MVIARRCESALQDNSWHVDTLLNLLMRQDDGAIQVQLILHNKGLQEHTFSQVDHAMSENEE
eukprot:280031-Pelagomonas_calceolata.AAC.1